MISDGPADDTLGIAADNGGQINESLPRVNVDAISNEFEPWLSGSEVAIDSIRDQRSGFSIDLGGLVSLGFNIFILAQYRCSLAIVKRWLFFKNKFSYPNS
ncbi:hypothetical protein ABIB48_001796 [Arthrobacter sp. UYCu511]